MKKGRFRLLEATFSYTGVSGQGQDGRLALAIPAPRMPLGGSYRPPHKTVLEPLVGFWHGCRLYGGIEKPSVRGIRQGRGPQSCLPYSQMQQPMLGLCS